MKKLLIVIMALAMITSFLPKVEAGETAELGLTVTFDQPLRIWSEPEGPFEVVEGELVTFRVIAEDLDTINVDLDCTYKPETATWTPISPDIITSPRREGVFEWRTALPADRSDILRAIFEATNIEGDRVELTVEISVIPRTISIELNPTTWALDHVKLSEMRSNVGSDGMPIHRIRNAGNVGVSVGMKYLPSLIPVVGPQPGLEQGVDTFITIVGTEVLPPTGEVLFDRVLPDMEISLPLTYGAPTEISQPYTGHQQGYELRAYPPLHILD